MKESFGSYIELVNSFPWMVPKTVTPEIQHLVEKFMLRMSIAISYVAESRIWPKQAAYDWIVTIGTDLDNGLISQLASINSLYQSEMREPTMLYLANNFYWNDSELGTNGIENPYELVIDLYKTGYSVLLDENDDEPSIPDNLLLIFNNANSQARFDYPSGQLLDS